jgi:hypothetical protein
MKIKQTFLFLFFLHFWAAAEGQNDAQLVKKDNLWGFQTQKGEWLIEPKYAFFFTDSFTDFMIVFNSENRCGVINKKGDTLVPLEFQEIQKISGPGFERGDKHVFFDAFLAKKGEKWGLIDQKATPLVPFEFDAADWVDDSTVFFSRPGRQIVRNDQGQTILETDFERAELLKWSDRKSRHLVAWKNDMAGLVDFSQKTVVPFKFNGIGLKGMGNANFVHVRNDWTQLGLWDLSGREILPHEYNSFDFLTDSLFLARLWEGGNVGLYDITGRERMPCEFTEIIAVGKPDRFKARKKDTHFGLFDAEGHALTLLELSDFQADDRLPALIFAKYQDGKWAVLNRDGRHLQFPLLDEYSQISRLGFVGKLGGFKAVFLPDGNRLTDFKYDYVQVFGQKDKARKRETEHGLNAETYFIGFAKDSGATIWIDNFGKKHL